MPQTGAKEDRSKIRAHSSVRFRVVAGLVAIMLAFTGLTVYSIVLHRNTVAKIRLINTSYFPLTHGISQIQVTQLVFNVLMDRLPDDPIQSGTRKWIDEARRYRPSTLHDLATLVSDTKSRPIPDDEREFLSTMARYLAEVEMQYSQNETDFQTLYSLMDTGRIDEARIHIETLKRAERLVDRSLISIQSQVRQHVTELAEQAEKDGSQATWILALLTLAVLAVAQTVIISTTRLLAPLKTLQQAVAKVARGTLTTRIDVIKQDEIGALANGFNKMTQALAERDQMLIRSERLATAGKMAAQVTHEIRNPLSSLGLNAELLEEELAADDGKKEARVLLQAMQDEIERLTGITEAYLNFARLPSPEPSFDDLNATVEAVLDFMGSEIADHQIAIESVLAPDLAPLLFDRGQIRQALINLLRNAVEAMPNGGEIRIETRQEGDEIEIIVSDTGSGVSAETIDQIFESFYSTKKSGTGLGLPLVRQICLAHGGDVRYEDGPEVGSRFIISLPGSAGATKGKGLRNEPEKDPRIRYD